MAKKLQDLVLVSEVGSDALILMKQDEGVGLRDLQIRVSDFLNGYLTTALLGTAIGQVPQLIDNGSGTPAFPAVSGEFLTNVTDAVVVGSDLVQGKVFLSDSLVSNNGVSNGTAATPKAVKDMGELKLSLTGGALTGDVSTNSAFIYENGAVTQIRLLDTSLKTIQSYSSGTNTITVGNIDLNAEITGLNLTFTDVAGTHTVYHTGNAVTIADYEAFATTEQEFNRSREMVSEENAASGFMHFGKHGGGVDYTAVNQGISSRTNSSAWANRLLVGRDDVDATGESKTDSSVVNIAGVISELASIGFDGLSQSWVKFPDAPDGTESYNSATGVITQHANALDAFAGLSTNPELTNGITSTPSTTPPTGWVSGDAGVHQYYTDTDGDFTFDRNGGSGGNLSFTYNVVNGTAYRVEFNVKDFDVDNIVAGDPSIVLNINGTDYILYESDGSKNYVFEFTASASTTSIGFRPRDDVNQVISIHSAFINLSTEEVVTERVDHFGLEGFLEEVTNTKPYIYPNGLIQSQATTMNGITTVATNRPASYYAVFDGDTTSSGLGVHFYNLSEADKLLVLGDSSNNLFRLADGRLVQFRIRQRTIAGAGNGDWGFINSTIGNYAGWDLSGSAYLVPQGAQDNVGSSFGGARYATYRNSVGKLQEGDPAIYMLRDSAANQDIAVNGECYWLPLGTVTRLNQGAYHPSFNPMGTKYWQMSGVNSGDTWNSGNVGNITSKAQAFNQTTTVGEVGAREPTGDIGTASQRPDGRFYDAIYADGQGGVQHDLRLSAQGGTISDILGTEDAKCKNGTQRGLQKLVMVQCQSAVANSTNAGSAAYQTTDTTIFNIGDKVSIVDNGIVVVTDATITTVNAASILWDSSDGTYSRVAGSTYYAVNTTELNTSVSGEFSQTDVIGDPAEILATPDLANGWLGNWISVIPDGTTVDYPLVRKSISNSFLRQLVTDTNGSTWIGTSNPLDSAQNAMLARTWPTGRIGVSSYTAHAYMTEAADNPVVYKGTEGLAGRVFAAQSHFALHGGLLAESTLNVILKSSLSPFNSLYQMQRSYLDYNSGKLYSVSPYDQRHEAIDLPLPNNDSHAVKTLPLVAEENGQLFLYYLSTELIWDTTLDSGAEFTDITESTSNNLTIGEYYHLTDGEFRGYYLCVDTSTTLLSSNIWSRDENGNIRNATGRMYLQNWSGNGWGDDNLITVLDGEGTKTDLNGNTVKVSCHKVPYALDWVRNTI